ncbi:hypothetical protein Hypma_009750 [Hypsizygus marmoreus]|uniref:Uncharacterized protein n=1 Tax=Hypsizygus marmoreus TaxID=39966 RepID=A0A369JWN5_HYPMA|nr:hypothetical protein Hypma_009750 [Hypsizygus marmoreus]
MSSKDLAVCPRSYRRERIGIGRGFSVLMIVSRVKFLSARYVTSYVTTKPLTDKSLKAIFSNAVRAEIHPHIGMPVTELEEATCSLTAPMLNWREGLLVFQAWRITRITLRRPSPLSSLLDWSTLQHRLWDVREHIQESLA